MPLTLQLVNETTLPDGGPVSVHVSGKRGIDIGRAAHLDWTLPDPTRYISSKHCEIRYKDGGYWLHDVSTNGTFLNGASHRMHEPHRLRNGDRFLVGQYIVAVTVEGAEDSGEGAQRAAAPPPPRPASDQEWWANEGEVPPPIDPKQLRAARNKAPINPDFLDWAADVPDPLQEQVSRPPNLSVTRPMPAPALSNMDWAEGPPSRVEAPPPPPPSVPAPRRPGRDSREDAPWRDSMADFAAEAPLSAVAAARSDRPAALPTFGVDGAASAAFVRQLAAAAGLPEHLLAQTDAAELAQQIGAVLRLLVENLMQLLSARQQAKRLAHSSQHTTVQATDNNPLKFCPSASDALRIMFGPANEGYLDANRAIAQGFADLKAHQIKTYAAMQHALTMVMADLDPKKIAKENEGSGLRSLRKAKLWDAYETLWETKVGRKGGEPIEAFMRYFAEAYDRDGQ